MKTKILAISMVALMMLSGLFVLAGSEGNDAATWEPNGSGDIYSYTLHYDSSEMANAAAQELQLTVAGTTPISHTAGTTTLSSVANEGSWGFDTTTGIGPFNSFYAAFDMTDGNKFYSVLNPNNLAKTIDNVDLDPISNYNIMWVLPTVYWSVDQNGDLTLTNDSSSGGVAYAHTINGVVREYVAYGVFEGSTATVGGNTVLTSTSGSSPINNETRATLRGYAHNYVMDDSLGSNSYSMLWNFYQWELYRLCCLTVMEGFNSQNIVGNGYIWSNTHIIQTGATNAYGAYAGNPATITDTSNAPTYGTSSVKLFIENAWSALGEYIDGVVAYGDTFYIDTSDNPSDTHETSDNVTALTYSGSMGSSGFSDTILTTSEFWGLGSNTGAGSSTVGVCDSKVVYSGQSNKRIAVGGGSTENNYAITLQYGLSYYSADSGLSSTGYGTTGARIAFVYGGSIEPETTVTFTTVDADTYNGSLSGNSIADVPIGSTITVSGNSVTIEDITITATTQADTAQYDYGVTWSVNDGDTVTADMVITATFTRAVNNYAVTVTADPVGYGTVSAASFPNKDYGSEITISSSSITIGEDTITATPETDTSEYAYGFDGFYIGDAKLVGGETITGTTDIVAKFTRTALYTVTIESSDIDKGTVSPTTITEVPEGTSISASGNTLTIGSATVTASPAEGFQVSWSVTSGTVEGDLTITATFEPIQSSASVLMSLIPLIVLFAVVMLAASAFASFNGNGVDLIKLLIGLAICVIVIATILIPAAGGI